MSTHTHGSNVRFHCFPILTENSPLSRRIFQLLFPCIITALGTQLALCSSTLSDSICNCPNWAPLFPFLTPSHSYTMTGGIVPGPDAYEAKTVFQVLK